MGIDPSAGVGLLGGVPRQYDAAVIVATAKGEGIVDEPVFDLSFANFEAAIAARIAYIKALPDGAFPDDTLPI